jgi:3-dehydroquinate synthase
VGEEITRRQERLLARLGLPTAPEAWPVQDLVDVMRSDKKTEAGQLRFVLPVRLGEARLFDVSEADVIAALASGGPAR